MTAKLKITILGCGSSPGVPRIGNDWGQCDPNEPKNRRTRCSILLEQIGDGGTTRVLVDTGPDVREQLLAAKVKALDAVVYTHGHADHTHGIDDLRAFWQNTKKLVDIYADAKTFAQLSHSFGYCFAAAPGSSYPPILKHRPIEMAVPFTIAGAGGPMTIATFPQQHGDIETLGLRVGPFAYSCDVSALPATALPSLANLDLWVVDALRYQTHPSHFSVNETLQWIDRIKPKRAVLTHMHIDLDYQTLKRTLPKPVEPAYDGLVLEVPL